MELVYNFTLQYNFPPALRDRFYMRYNVRGEDMCCGRRGHRRDNCGTNITDTHHETLLFRMICVFGNTWWQHKYDKILFWFQILTVCSNKVTYFIFFLYINVGFSLGFSRRSWVTFTNKKKISHMYVILKPETTIYAL